MVSGEAIARDRVRWTYCRIAQVALGDGLEKRRLADVCQSNLWWRETVSRIGESKTGQAGNPQCRF